MSPSRSRILLLADGLAVGGAERQIVELLKGLARSRRFSVVLGVLDRGGAFEAAAAGFAVEVLPLRRRARFDGTPALMLIREARRTGVGLIHTEGWISGLAALPAGRFLRLPIVNGTFRGAPGAVDARVRLARWCAWRADAVVSNARAEIEALGLMQHPCARVIANGVDLARFDDVVAAPGGDAVVCMVANFNRAKDHRTLIQAWPRVRQSVPGGALILVGHDGGTLNEVRGLVRRLGVTSSVRFVTDTQAPEPFIAASAVCVLSTHGEGLSNAVIEYMALRKPVVATECAGNAVLVRDGGTGFLVAPGSPESLADRLIELLRDPPRARQIGSAGRRLIEQHHSLERMVAEYEALYDHLQARG